MAEWTSRMMLVDFKAVLREQGFMLLLDQEHALATLPRLHGSASAEQIHAIFEDLRRVAAAASGPLGAESEACERSRTVRLGRWADARARSHRAPDPAITQSDSPHE
jgi:hypothetical protein